MKTSLRKLGAGLLAITLLTTGCDAVRNASNRDKGTAIGASGGAAIGGIIGNNVGDKKNSVLGALIGAVVGGVAGRYIGNRMDRQAERIEEEIPGATVTRAGEGINVTFDEKSGVYFATNKYNLNPASAATLNKLAGIFKEYPHTLILVEGHTDNTGRAEYNSGLSRHRAESVTDYLVNQGISPGRFTTKWYGEDQPRYDNSTANGRAKNRRVEIAIIADEKLKEEARKNAH
ncbi:OmpA family protein [Sinomicrobium pectinilyticum]|uniref:OmpA family protein n=1 Tax=Sinomicrobium pectinilyticum TaxID=1084421 RepID=A0A3N0DQL4_SINP1|nr:OmpA family protein [Sinomicrobium pectinilyticum]RNL77929.1 OmpA family protein [Sinomicrobium pectinilyticum]